MKKAVTIATLALGAILAAWPGPASAGHAIKQLYSVSMQLDGVTPGPPRDGCAKSDLKRSIQAKFGDEDIVVEKDGRQTTLHSIGMRVDDAAGEINIYSFFDGLHYETGRIAAAISSGADGAWSVTPAATTVEVFQVVKNRRTAVGTVTIGPATFEPALACEP